ncbi:MAG: hypothetical protein GTO63_24970, partial [Anaerolineae bacterium]|nr:hypothetical protein [Anaerolineae bacterium]NIN97980.1 hypothetical protein [Anaerolineae bacterium]
YWRPSLLPPTLIVYILVISPILERMDTRVIEAFRPLVQTDDASFNRLVSEASRLNLALEVLTFGLGGAFGLWFGHWWLSGGDAFWLGLYVSLSAGLMFGVLGWTFYGAIASTRLISELHRQPLRIDIFDIKPFEPIGRQSVIVALVTVGGIALGTLFGVGRAESVGWEYWIAQASVMIVPILIFFLNMRDTHRVLAEEKKRELEAVSRDIVLASRALMKRRAAGESIGTLAEEINALVSYEERVQEARTWPYNTGMLRTVVVSVILPAGAAAAQIALGVLLA